MSDPKVTVTEYEQCVNTDPASPLVRQKHDDAQICLGCHESPIVYQTRTCDHPVFCERCAMKTATGGKCKVCHQMFGGLVRME